MKRFLLLKFSVLLLGIGAALVLTPACKAQSEISPDHFDGTDSWAAAASPVSAQARKQPAVKPSLQAKSQKEAKSSSFQLAADREATKPIRREGAAVDRKRKLGTTNPEQQ